MRISPVRAWPMGTRAAGLAPARRALLAGVTMLAWLLSGAAGTALAKIDVDREIFLSNEEFRRLDTFEGVSLGKADKTFNKGGFRLAAAQYAAFLKEYPRSIASPYALLRQGRSMHHDDKRFAALKLYDEVLTFYANDVPYAAGALYYTGLAHWENGDVANAMAAWAKLADDADYSKVPLAADAVYRLADHLWKQGKYEKSAELFAQVAVDFRTKNSDRANNAINRALDYYLRVKPDEQAARRFYLDVKSFHREPRRVPETLEDVAGDAAYWARLLHEIAQRDRFDTSNDDVQKARASYLAYWTEQLAPHRPEDDEYQLRVIDWRVVHTGDRQRWIEEIDAQFKRGDTSDFSRIIRFIQAFKGFDEKIAEYFAKVDWQRMSNEQIVDALDRFLEMGEKDLASGAWRNLRWDEAPDGLKRRVFDLTRRKAFDLAEATTRRFDDEQLGQYLLMNLYYGSERYADAATVAGSLVSAARYAGSAWWIKGLSHKQLGQYEESIQAFLMCENQPKNLWEIADVRKQQRKFREAIVQYAEIETWFKSEAPAAALASADVLRRMGEKARYVAALRNLRKKYPKSSQSARAHVLLEDMGVAVGAGVEAD